MNKENDYYHNVEGAESEGTVDCVNRDDVGRVLNEMKNARATGLSDSSMELIAAIREARIQSYG